MTEGMVGMTLACALAGSGVATAVIERANPVRLMNHSTQYPNEKYDAENGFS